MTVHVQLGDSLEVLRRLPADSISAVVTDPPYGLGKPPDMVEVLTAWLAGVPYVPKGKGFMGKEWDAFVPGPELWREVYRVLKPGAHAAVFAGTRTQDVMGLALRLAGFEVRDSVAWLYGCLDEATEAATPDGPKPYHRLKAGDPVLCYDALHGEYSYQPILEVVEYEYSDTAFRLVGDSGSQVVSRNHRVLTERGGGETFQLAETLERTSRVPFLEDLPALQRALSNRQPLPSGPEQGLREGVRGGAGSAGEDRRDAPFRGSQRCNGSVCDVRCAHVETCRVAAAGSGSNVQSRVQREGARGRAGCPCAQGARVLDSRGGGSFQGPYDRGVEPLLERRLDVSEAQGSLCGPADQVCPVPCGHAADGSERWLRDGAPVDCGAGHRQAVDPIGVCPPCKPRCDGQPACESHALRDERPTQAIRAWGGHRTEMVRVVPFHYTGKVWCLRVPTGAFVAVRGGVAFPTGNSGFPKSLDVSKAIDAAIGAERPVVGFDASKAAKQTGKACTSALGDFTGNDGKVTAPGCPESAAWAGWGTALKPGHEPILIVRKPFPGTVAGNVLAHGTGGIHVDAGRIGYASEADQAKLSAGVEAIRERGGVMDGSWKNSSDLSGANPASTLGRWPANVALDETTAEELGESARYFYCPKASRSEREAGLEDFPEVRRTDGRETEIENPRLRTSSRKCNHPTVKPVALMQWLLRLLVPPGGVCLDPFGGSGTTGIAAVREGFDALLIEREAPYVEIARARIAHAMKGIE